MRLDNVKEIIELGGTGRQARIKSRIRFTSTRVHRRLRAEIDAYEDNTSCSSRRWDETTERDHIRTSPIN